MNAAEEFESHRHGLFKLAYRMLGSVPDAEDVIQDAFLRWARVQRGEVKSPRAYLNKTVTRLSIDRLRLRQREEYLGPWLPDPLPTENPVEHAESVTMAFLVLLEKLQPIERAVFLLKKVFDYSHDEIAEALERSPANCRKAYQRAREHLGREKSRFTPCTGKGEEITDRFLGTLQTGDLHGLLDLLCEDITLWSDGGGKVSAARVPLQGAALVAKFLLNISRIAPPDLAVEKTRMNGEPALITRSGSAIDSVMVFEVTDSKIAALRVVRNPDKLRHLDRTS